MNDKLAREDDGAGLYHYTKHGTKWPNCIQCRSENTAVTPATGEWHCQDCGRQWHMDELLDPYGDGEQIPGKIEEMVTELVEYHNGDSV